MRVTENYRFSDTPPYTVLRNPWLSYDDICRIETIGRLLDLFCNHDGFSTALNLLNRTVTLSRLMDRMAADSESEALSGLSSLRVYDLFFRLAAPCLEAAERGLLADALFFDFCCHEMPRQGKLPQFIARHHLQCNWPGGRQSATALDLPPTPRVKAFRFTFKKDYRCMPWGDHPVEVTFVYASVEKQRLKIFVM